MRDSRDKVALPMYDGHRGQGGLIICDHGLDFRDMSYWENIIIEGFASPSFL